MKPVPILFLGDNPADPTGLSRILRDLAAQLSRSPKFRVGSLGMTVVGATSRRLPWQQYIFPQDNAWGSAHLQRAWMDFAGQERGIVFTVWDATRLHWFSRPQFYSQANQQLSQFLGEGRFQRWGYFPIDATGPGDRLSALATDALLGYDRLLAYTKWGQGVIERSVGQQNALERHLDWLPHGINGSLWQIRDRAEARKRFEPLVLEGDRLIGAIGTNQARKDWGLVASACQQLLAHDPRVRFWWHLDLPDRHWNVNALLDDFGLRQHTLVTPYLSDDELCWCYNACDLTLHPGAGEGFGYPIFESLACGVPVLHGCYGGGADVLSQCIQPERELQAHGGDHRYLVPHASLRVEGRHNQVRPVFDPVDWAAQARAIVGQEMHTPEQLRASVSHLFWDNLWPTWERWLEEGL